MPYLSQLVGRESNGLAWIIGDSKNMTWWKKRSRRVHIFALGDVGAMVLIGLKLLGNDCIAELGIYDVRENVPERWEFECNQIMSAGKPEGGPVVSIVKDENLFDCDVFLFCASLRVPPVSETGGDVRMAQLSANAGLMRKIAGRAASEGYRGLFGVVSDPVDPLCKVAVLSGLDPAHVKGFGLGVMNARACYYAKKDPALTHYIRQGRAFGPHGEDLVIADSLENYDHEKSLRLTDLAAHANLSMREMGFKPYVAPALSSAANSVCDLLRGDWHYSSVWMDGAFFGTRNRCTADGIEIDDPMLPEVLYHRCYHAWDNLKRMDV